MDKNKKTRLFVRILCAILAVIMTLSIILPVAYADEIDAEAPYVNQDGFQYVEENGEWFLQATTENPVFRLTNVPITFTRANLPVLIANLDTYEVQIINLLKMTGYAVSADLDEGYYVIYTNNYAWEDEQHTPWALNNGFSIYFYHGDIANFEKDKYGLNYVVAENNIFDIPLNKYTENRLPAIQNNRTFHLEDEDAIYPLSEIYNWDEILTRMEYIDLEATLELGKAVYRDGYVPNSIPATDEESETTTPSNNEVLGELAAGGAVTSDDSVTLDNPVNNESTPADDIPVAQPEIITPPPADDIPVEDALVSNESNNGTDGTLSTDNTDTPEVGKSELEQSAEQLLNQAYDILGVGEKDEATRRREAIGAWIRNGLIVAAIVVVTILYFKEKQKNQEAVEESLENNKYFDGHIE